MKMKKVKKFFINIFYKNLNFILKIKKRWIRKRITEKN